MLIDLHCHTCPMSPCSIATYSSIVDDSLKAGFQGLVLANHYFKPFLNGKNLTSAEYAKQYVEEFKKTEEYGRTKNFKVFFAVELTPEEYPLVHLLIYGVPFEFLYENPEIYNLPLEKIYRIVKSYDGALIQAHPYRSGMTVLNTDFLDGVEINCHPIFGPTYKEKLTDIAKEKGLHITCGSDFHGKTERTKCGMVIPDDISDSIQLKDFILSENEKTLLVHEQGEEEPKYIKVKA